MEVKEKIYESNWEIEHLLSEPDGKQLESGEDGYEVIYVHSSGGRVWRHELVDVKGIDYNIVLEIAIEKANIGCQVHILPTLSEHHPLREKLFRNSKERKCPDLKIDGRFTEIKTPTGNLHKQKISYSIRMAYTQADEVIIRLKTNFNTDQLRRIAKGRFLTHQNLTLIEFKISDKYVCFKRSDFL